jgi:hypothetical protein
VAAVVDHGYVLGARDDRGMIVRVFTEWDGGRGLRVLDVLLESGILGVINRRGEVGRSDGRHVLRGRVLLLLKRSGHDKPLGDVSGLGTVPETGDGWVDARGRDWHGVVPDMLAVISGGIVGGQLVKLSRAGWHGGALWAVRGKRLIDEEIRLVLRRRGLVNVGCINLGLKVGGIRHLGRGRG